MFAAKENCPIEQHESYSSQVRCSVSIRCAISYLIIPYKIKRMFINIKRRFSSHPKDKCLHKTVKQYIKTIMSLD